VAGNFSAWPTPFGFKSRLNDFLFVGGRLQSSFARAFFGQPSALNGFNSVGGPAIPNSTTEAA
jgi:hypothetical protein